MKLTNESDALKSRLVKIEQELSERKRLMLEQRDAFFEQAAEINAKVEALTRQLAEAREQLDAFLKGRITKAMLLERAEKAERQLAEARQERDTARDEVDRLATALADKERPLFEERSTPKTEQPRCRICKKTRRRHCDMDEPGLDHDANCQKFHHEFRISKPNVPKVLPLVQAIYQRSATGCCLHILTDDKNVSDADAQFCLKHAVEKGHIDCIEAAANLVRMSRTQRLKIAQQRNG